MTIINIIKNLLIFNIKSFLDYNTNHLQFNDKPEIVFFLKYSITTYNVCLIGFIIIFILNFCVSLFFKQFQFVISLIKNISLWILSILLAILFIKLYITLKIENILGFFFLDIKIKFFQLNSNLGYLEYFLIYSSSLSDSILILSLLIGIICLELLGSKNLFKSINNISIFFLFSFFVTLMVTTNNLLIMFISFEFIFFPTVYFAYNLGYSKKIDLASKILIYWTLFGSFLVLLNLIYLYSTYNTLNYIYLIKKQYSTFEMYFLFINFLIGFGIKIPLAPLHYWLLKVHVESPTAFSIYLSGFLVKSALYCLYMFISLFNDNSLYIGFLSWIIYSLVISTLGFARQVDIKKLIAWATIQEMSFILLFITFKQFFLLHTSIIFIILHGLLSAYMFYIVDILQRRFQTRSLHYIKGLNLLFPEITKYIWFLILLFSGFPLTVKFFIEWNIISVLLESNRYILLFTLIFLNLLSVVFFCKIMFIMIYGSPIINQNTFNFYELQKKEKLILNLILFLILFLLILIYIINCKKKDILQTIVYDGLI